MADSFHSHRSRDARARGEFDAAVPDTSSDPLAELARLIGQSDANGESGRHDRYEAPAAAEAEETASGLDWAAEEGYPAQDDYGQSRYVAPPAESHSALPAHDLGDEPRAGPRFFSGPAAAFNGFREEDATGPSAGYAASAEQPPAPAPGRRGPAFPVAPHEPPYAAEARAHDSRHDDAPDEYDDDDEMPRRRGGLVVVMAVLGLAVIGTAGAFGYRAMFGGAMLPTLPPIIKASSAPNKIVPNSADVPAANPGQAGAATTPATEQLAPAPEQPVDLQQSARTAPRVVSTIPIAPSAGPTPQSAPAYAPPVASAFPPPAVAAPAVVAPAPPAAAAPAEPKKVHTVSIHNDQPAGNAAAAPSPPPPRKPASPPPRGNAPLSIVPGGGGDVAAAPPAHSHAPAASAAAPLAVASAAPENASEGRAASSGGYAVQVSSQRSEAEAKAAFHELKAKFPKELGGREPIVRRTDLGAKGIYYRALVGPFASMEEAAGLCSSLKAAGGNCLIQRN